MMKKPIFLATALHPDIRTTIKKGPVLEQARRFRPFLERMGGAAL
jgi:hypothetical protein